MPAFPALSPVDGAALVLCAASLLLDLLLAPRFAGGSGRADRGSCQGLMIAVTLALVLGVTTALTGLGRFEGLNALGLLPALAGLGLRYWAVGVLGEHFTWRVDVSPSQAIVTRGPYAAVRHPGYAGGVLAMAGLSWAFGSLPALAAVVLVYLPLMVWRIRIEEAALLGSPQGAAYARFAEGRARLVPGLY